ncbi:MAG: RT0821/Lpp0805 family surface protein [Pseudomonadota bacterium]
MNKIFLTTAIIASFGLVGCDTLQTAGTKQQVGTAGGAVLGGILGSKVGGGSGQLWATGAGALIGALVGSEVGRSLDRADMTYLANANQRALEAPVGEQITWNNPDSGNSGSVVAVRDGSDTAGRYCREYQQTIYVGGQQETGFGTACQMPDGTWEIIS